MYELSPQDVNQISHDISRLEINYSHHADDLIDHFCCDVEHEMMKGLDFSEAYEKVKRKMGSLRRLREIQEATLYAVDSKYRKMKNMMKISGIAGTIILVFASLFKIMHWPGAERAILISLPFPYVVYLSVYLSITRKDPNHSIYHIIIPLPYFFCLFSSQLSRHYFL
jgi:hypothetical protein